jgi:serine phosphatase RsbU (regulator of sigma subunit)
MFLEEVTMVDNDTTTVLASPDPTANAEQPASRTGAAEAAWTDKPASENVVNLRSLVSHSTLLAADTPLETAQKFFSSQTMDFVAVLEGGRPLGLCARRQVGMVLGSRYGFSLFARNPVRNYLLTESLVISVADSIHDVLSRVAARHDEYFYDDIILVDEAGLYLGCIFVRNLVRLQHGLLLENLQQLEKKNCEIERKNVQMEQELNMAGKVQHAMLPQAYPVFPPHSDSSILRFNHRYLPTGRVSGDFFHVRRISDHLAGVFICDVMGHGVRSAMVTAAMRALVEQLQSDASHPGELLEHLNQGLLAILRQSDETIYASAAYLLIDTADLEICWASAGHPCPLLLRDGGASIIPLALPKDKRGKVLGLMETATYQTGETTLEPGDRLLLYTDGIYEVFSGDKEFGMDGLLATLQRHTELAAPGMLDRLLDAARAFGDSQEFEDDVCLLAIDIAPDKTD